MADLYARTHRTLLRTQYYLAVEGELRVRARLKQQRKSRRHQRPRRALAVDAKAMKTMMTLAAMLDPSIERPAAFADRSPALAHQLRHARVLPGQLNATT